MLCSSSRKFSGLFCIVIKAVSGWKFCQHELFLSVLRRSGLVSLSQNWLVNIYRLIMMMISLYMFSCVSDDDKSVYVQLRICGNNDSGRYCRATLQMLKTLIYFKTVQRPVLSLCNLYLFHKFLLKSSRFKTNDQPGTFRCARSRCKTCPFLQNRRKCRDPRDPLRSLITSRAPSTMSSIT